MLSDVMLSDVMLSYGMLNDFFIVLQICWVAFSPTPSLIFTGKAWSLPLDLSPTMDSIRVGSSLARKYYTRVEVFLL